MASRFTPRPSGAVSFGPYRLEPTQGWLRRGDTVIHLRPKTWEVLCFLVANPGRLLKKEDLLSVVWGGSVVSDTMPSISVAEIRRALGDAPQSPRYVETVHGRGFRFIGRVDGDAAAISGGQRGPLTFPTGRSSMVGRHAEQASLENFLSTPDPRCRVAFVAGEAGIGKTTLVDRVVSGLASDRAAADERCVARGQCLASFGEGYPYWPVLAALQGMAQQRPDVLPLLRALAPSWLARLPMLTTPDELAKARRAASDASAAQVIEELFALVRAIGPVVWVFEDLHWADAATLDLIALLSESPGLERVWVIGTTRVLDPVGSGHGVARLRRELRRRGRCLEIGLSGLADDEVREYVADRIQSSLFPAWLPVRLLAHTGGNPLFLVHTVDHLVTGGALAAFDSWDEAREGALAAALGAIPPTLRELVREDVGALSETQRAVLAAASVVGLEFEAAAVAGALGLPLAPVDEVCGELSLRTALVTRSGESTWPDGSVGGQYVFRHPLYQRGVYEDQAPAARREAHQRIGNAMAQAFGDRASDVSAVIAAHFERGGEIDRAVEFHRLAADTATRGYAAREAAFHLRRALDLVRHRPDSERREIELLSELGKVLPALQGFGDPDLLSLYLRVRSLQAAGGDAAGEFAAMAGLLLTSLMQRKPQPAEDLAREMLALAVKDSDPKNRAYAELLMGAVLYHQGDLPGTVQHAERSLEVAPTGLRLGPIDHRSAALVMQGAALWQGGRPDNGLEQARRGLDLARSGVDPFNVVISLQGFLAILQWRGDVEAALVLAQELSAGVADQGVVQAGACAQLIEAWARLARGDRDLAERRAEEGLVSLRQHGSMMQSVYLLTVAAELYFELGRLAEASRCLDEAAGLIDDGAERWWEPELHRWRAVMADANGEEPAVGRRSLEMALELAAGQGASSLRLRAALTMLHRSRGAARAEARSLVESTLGLIEGGDGTRDVAVARRALARSGRSTPGPAPPLLLP